MDDFQTQQALESERGRDRLAAEKEATETAPPARMGWGIFIFCLILGLIADLVEVVSVGTIGWLVGIVVDFILLMILGVNAAGKKTFKKWIWGPLAETIWPLNVVPFLRAGFLIWAFISSRNQKLQAVNNVMGKVN